MHRIMGSYLIEAHKADDVVPSNSDSVHVVSNRWRHENCSRSHGTQPLRGSSMPPLTAQFYLDDGVLCSVRWKHSSWTLSTTASVPESARAAGLRPTIFLGMRGPWRGPKLLTIDTLRSSPEHCRRVLHGSPHVRFFTRGLALSLLQRKPDEWRRQHATPSSGGSANTTTSSPSKDKNTRLNATAPSAVVVVPTNNDEDHDEDPEGDEVRTSSPEKEHGRKKRKRSAAAIDALFDDAIGRKVVRSALEPASAPTPVKSGTKIASLS
jgi:hypothetical protein